MPEKKEKKTDIMKRQKKALLDFIAKSLRNAIEDEDVMIEYVDAKDCIKPCILITKIDDTGCEVEQWSIDAIKKVKMLKCYDDYDETESYVYEKECSQ